MLKNIIVLAVLFFPFSFAHAQQSETLSQVLGIQEDVNTRYSTMDKSPSGLEEYKRKMMIIHQEAEKIGKKYFFSTITLQRPLLLDEALETLEKYKIVPKLVYVFANSVQSDELVTLGIRPDSNNFYGSIRDSIKFFEEESGASVMGVVAVIGYVGASKLHPAQLDDRVFLVDVSTDSSLTNNQGDRSYMHHFGWDLYHQQ